MIFFVFTIPTIQGEKIQLNNSVSSNEKLKKDQLQQIDVQYSYHDLSLIDINEFITKIPKETAYIEMRSTDYIILHYILERTEKGIIFTCPYITIPLLDKYGIPDSDDSNDGKQFINIPYSLEANEIRIDLPDEKNNQEIIKHYLIYLPANGNIDISFNGRNVTNLFYDFPTDFVIDLDTSGVLIGIPSNDTMTIKAINSREIYLHADFIINKTKSMHTRISTLHRGLLSMVKGEQFSFSYVNTRGKKECFILPGMDHLEDNTKNIMDENIYFYCLRGIKGKKVSFDNLPVCNTEQFDNLICHSNKSQVDVRIDGKVFSYKPYQSNLAQNSHIKPEMTEEAEKRLKIVDNAINNDVNLLIEGTTASAKTYTVELICDQMQLPLLRFNFSPSTTIEDLIGDYIIKNIHGRQKLVFTEGAFTLAFIHGYILLLDELSLAKETVIEPLMGILDTKELYISGRNNNRPYKMHPNFRIICTQNPAGSTYERTKFSERIMDHFRFIDQHRFPPMKEKELNKISQKIISNLPVQQKAFKAHKEAVKRNEERKRIAQEENKEKSNSSDTITPVLKEYTIRDQTRVQSFLTKTDASLDHILHLVYESSFDPSHLKPVPISFQKEKLSSSLWTKFYYDMEYALEAGNHILVVSSSAYTSSCYVDAFLEYKKEMYEDEKHKRNVYPIEDYTTIYGCSNISNDVLIGSYIFTEKKSKFPKWVDSSLLTAIINGYPCKFDYLHLLKSNVIERLNSLLELVPNDGNNHYVRFDERNHEPVIKMNPNFRIIATVEEDSISRFSPALLNRFLVVYVNDKKGTDYALTPKGTEKYSIYDTDHYLHTSTPIQKLIKTSERGLDYFSKKNIVKLINFMTNLVEENELQKYVEYYLKFSKDEKAATSLDVFSTQKLHQKYFNKTLMSLCMNRAICIDGSAECGKTYLLDTLMNLMNIYNKLTLHLSPESDFNELMGFYSINCSFNMGLILDAITKGKVLVIDHAENITPEMFEEFQQFMDPLLTSFVYCHQTFDINPNFRIIFVFTTQKGYLKFKLPKYMKRITIPDYTLDEVCDILHCKDNNIIRECIDHKVFTLSYLIKCKTIYNNIVRMKGSCPVSWFYLAVYLSNKYQDFYNTYKDEKSLNPLFTFVKAPVKCEIIQNEDNNKIWTCNLTKDSLSLSIPLYKDCISLKRFSWFTNTLFKAALIQGVYPMLCVGLGDDKNELISALYPEIETIEMAHSLECFHIIGQTTLMDKNTLTKEINTLTMNNLGKNSPILNNWMDHLEKLRENCIESELTFQPGIIINSLIQGKSACLESLDLLSKDIYPRLIPLLHYDRSEGFIEDLGNTVYDMLEIIANNNSLEASTQRFLPICATCEPHCYNNVSTYSEFFPVFCDPVSKDEIVRRYPVVKELLNSVYFKQSHEDILEELAKLNISYSMIYILNRIYKAFNSNSPALDALFFMNYCVSNDYNRKTLYRVFYADGVNPELVQFLKPESNKDTEVTEGQVRKIFTSEISDMIWKLFEDKNGNSEEESSKFFPVRTIVLMASALVLGFKYEVPVILEGAPGIGKSDCVKRLFTNGDNMLQRFNFSPSSTIQDFFGTITVGSEKSLIFKPGDLTKFLNEFSDKLHILLLDEINLAPLSVVEVFSSLVKAAYSDKREFYIPGYNKVRLPPLYVISALNPAVMSSQRTSLPSSMTNLCLFFKDISYSLPELLKVSQSIIEKITQYDYHDGAYDYTVSESNEQIIQSSEFFDKLNNLYAKAIDYSREFRTPFSLRDTIKLKELCVQGNLPIYAALWIVFGCKYYGDAYKSISNTLNADTTQDVTVSVKDSKIQFKSSYNYQVSLNVGSSEKKNQTFPSLQLTSNESALLYKLALSYRTQRAIIVYGPSPSGKSYTIEKYAKMMGKKMTRIPLHPEISIGALIGEKRLIETGGKPKIEFQEGPLPQAMRNGEWILIEDIHMAVGELLERFNSLCEECPTFKLLEADESNASNESANLSEQDESKKAVIFSRDPKENEIQIHSDFRLFFTMSTKDVSTIPAPLLSRCIIIATDSLSNVKNVQELVSFNKNSEMKPEYFGEKESKSFRRALCVINSNRKDQYEEEFGEKIKSHETVYDKKLFLGDDDPVSKFMSSLKKSKFVAVEDVKNELWKILSYDIGCFLDDDYRKILEEAIIKYHSSLVVYPLNLIDKLIQDHGNHTGKVLSFESKYYQQFINWHLCMDYDNDLELKDEYINQESIQPPILNDDFTYVEDWYKLKQNESPYVHDILFCFIKCNYNGLYDIKHVKDHQVYYKELEKNLKSGLLTTYKDLKEFITAYVTICEADDTIQRDDYKLLETDALDEANKKNKRMTELEKKLEYAQNVLFKFENLDILKLYKGISEMIKQFKELYSSFKEEEDVQRRRQFVLNDFSYSLKKFKGSNLMEVFASVKDDIDIESIRDYYKIESFQRDINYELIKDKSAETNYTRLYTRYSHFIVFSDELRSQKKSIVSSVFEFFDIFKELKLNQKALLMKLDKLDDLYDTIRMYVNGMMCYIAKDCCFDVNTNKFNVRRFMPELAKYDLYVHNNDDLSQFYGSLKELADQELLCEEIQKQAKNLKKSKKIVQLVLNGDEEIDTRDLNLNLYVVKLRTKLDNKEISEHDEEYYPYLTAYKKEYRSLQDIVPGEKIPQVVLQAEAELMKNQHLSGTDNFILNSYFDRWDQYCLICPYLRDDEYSLVYSLIDSLLKDKEQEKFLEEHLKEITDIHTIIEDLDRIQDNIYKERIKNYEDTIEKLKGELEEDKEQEKQIRGDMNYIAEQVKNEAKDYVRQINKQKGCVYSQHETDAYNCICSLLYKRAMSKFFSEEYHFDQKRSSYLYGISNLI